MAHNFIADKATLDAVKVDTTDIRTVVNAIPTGGKAVFTANGTFTVPVGVTEIYITAIAAGTNGSSSSSGASGAFVYCRKFIVTPGAVIPVTVGVGNTIVGSFLTLIVGGGVPGGAYSSGNGGHGILGIGGGGGGNTDAASLTTAAGVGGIGYGGGGGYGRTTGGAGAPGVVVIEW